VSEQERWNYFNYFTEIEEHFQRARGTSLFLLSPLDWALIETWKDGGVPLAAVLRGIDAAFEKWHTRKKKLQQVNSIAYCAQAVFKEAQIMAGAVPPRRPIEAPFTLEELRTFLESNINELRGKAGMDELADALQRIADAAETHYGNLEELEQRLTALEDKMKAIVRTTQSDEDLFEARRELDATLRPYRGKMTADQLAMLEKQYLERHLLEKAALPRLSLFYLR
jgi:hypothetical protein